MQFQKNELVFAKCGKFPPWPAKIKKSQQNGTYKVSFVGESSYAHCYPEDIFTFTSQKASQIYQLYVKKQPKGSKLGKALSIAIKQFQAQKQKSIASQQKLNNSQSKIIKPQIINNNTSQAENKVKKIVYTSISKTPVQPVIQLIKAFDKIYDEIIQPNCTKSHDLKDQQNMYLVHKEQQRRIKQLMSSESNMIPIEKIFQNKIIQKLISLIKVYDTFHEQCITRKQLMIFLKEKYQEYQRIFRQQISKKKTLTHRDQNMLYKFQNFKAFT